MDKMSKIISAALCAAAMGAVTAQAGDEFYGTIDDNWANGSNWGGNAYPTAEEGYLNRYAELSTAVPTNMWAFRMGQTGDATFNLMPGGEYIATQHSSWGSWLGMASGYSATINQSGGSLTVIELEVGSQEGSFGYYNQSGGTATVVNALYDLSLYVGATKNAYKNGSEGGTGTFSMTGGTLLTRQGVQMGHASYVGEGTFEVWGTGPDEIGIGSYSTNYAGTWTQYSNSTLRVGISTNGITPIVIDDSNNSSNATALFAAGSILDISFIDGASFASGSWTVMECKGMMVNAGLKFPDDMADYDKWGFAVSNNNLMVGYNLGWSQGNPTNIVLPPSPGRTLYWNGLGGDLDTSNPDNWQTDSLGTPASWGVYSEDTLYIGHYYCQDEGTNLVANYDGNADFEAQTSLNVGWAREGTYNHNSGTLTFQTGSSSKQYVGGYNEKGKGTVNLNGGTLSYNTLVVATSGADGTVNVNDGTLNIGRASTTVDGYGSSIVVGNHTGSQADFNVYGGEVITRGALVMGFNSSSNTFSVYGSDASLIKIGKDDNTVDGAWAQYAGTLKVFVDEGGLTPIQVTDSDNSSSNGGDAYFAAGALLYAGWEDGVQNYGTFDVMTWGGELRDEGLALDPSVDTDIWSFAFVDTDGDTTNDTLRVTAYGETEKGTSLGWLAEYGLAAADDEADTDGDGHANWEEYLTGTNPTNAASVLAVTAAENLGDGNFVITWNSVEDKTYMIQTNTSLTVDAPGTLVTGIEGQPDETSYTGTISGAGTVFYEVGVE